MPLAGLAATGNAAASGPCAGGMATSVWLASFPLAICTIPDAASISLGVSVARLRPFASISAVPFSLTPFCLARAAMACSLRPDGEAADAFLSGSKSSFGAAGIGG